MIEYKTGAFTIVLRPDGIVWCSNNEDWSQPDTKESVEEDILAITKVIDGQPNRCILTEVPNRHFDRKHLIHYQQAELGEVARGLLLNSFGAKVMGNLFLKLSRNKPNKEGRIVLTKLFTKKEEAVKWLLEQIEKNKNK